MTDNRHSSPVATTRSDAAGVHPDAAALASPPQKVGGNRLATTAFDISKRYAIVGVLVVVVILASTMYPGFFDPGNIKNILSQNSPVGIVAVGMTFVIIAGGFDLSVAAIFAASGVAYASFADNVPLYQAAALAMAVGIVAGVINGLLVTKLNINPFVATLGSASVFAGLAFLYSDSMPIIPTNPAFQDLDNGDLIGIPYSVLIFVFVLLVGGVVLARTVFGRSVYAVGGNAEAARLAGMRVERIRLVTYVITGFCAAVAGMIVASRTGVGQADSGASITLDAIAIVIIGGTSLMGGEGAMWRTAIGLAIIATINNLFDSLALDTAAQSLMKGLIVLGAVALDARTRRRA